jgi:hypothetical protein
MKHQMISTIWHGIHRGIKYEIWQSDGEYCRAASGGGSRWNYYIFPPKGAEDYVRFRNGGCTYDEMVAGSRKMGCDYVHFMNLGHTYTLADIESDLKDTIDGL